MEILFISGGEIIFILIIAILVFGAKRLPEIARVLGKGVKQFKDAANEIKKEMTEEQKDMTEGFQNMKEKADEINKNVKKYRIFEDPKNNE
jgi:sec-independent protein translocase protein TatA